MRSPVAESELNLSAAGRAKTLAWKILLVLEAGIGGTARHLLDLSRGLVRAGHSVHVLYSPGRGDSGFVAALEAIPGLTTATVAMGRAPSPADLLALARIRRYLTRRGPFDIVHAHSTKAILACLAATGLEAATVYTQHGFRTLDPTLHRLVRAGFGLIEYLLTRSADVMIAVSPEERRHAIGLGVPERKLRTVVNGIRPVDGPSRTSLRSRFGLGGDEICVGFVGRFAYAKAPQRALEAFSMAPWERHGARLVMLGDGPMKPQLETQARALGIGDRVIWVDNVPGSDAMAAFDVLAMPSLYDAMPYVLLEAAAAGLPIVATAVGGTSALISPGENGYVVPAWDAQTFADMLGRIIADPALRQSMSEASRRIGQTFTVDRMVAETEAVYRAALDGRAKR